MNLDTFTLFSQMQLVAFIAALLLIDFVIGIWLYRYSNINSKSIIDTKSNYKNLREEVKEEKIETKNRFDTIHASLRKKIDVITAKNDAFEKETREDITMLDKQYSGIKQDIGEIKGMLKILVQKKN